MYKTHEHYVHEFFYNKKRLDKVFYSDFEW